MLAGHAVNMTQLARRFRNVRSGLSTWSTDSREFKQIATAGAATAIVVDEVWGEYVAVARQNSTLSNAKYK